MFQTTNQHHTSIKTHSKTYQNMRTPGLDQEGSRRFSSHVALLQYLKVLATRGCIIIRAYMGNNGHNGKIIAIGI
jgi:hypothetical protein